MRLGIVSSTCQIWHGPGHLTDPTDLQSGMSRVVLMVVNSINTPYNGECVGYLSGSYYLISVNYSHLALVRREPRVGDTV